MMKLSMGRTGGLGVLPVIWSLSALCAAAPPVRAQHVLAGGFRPGSKVHVAVQGRFHSFPGYQGAYHVSIASSQSRYWVYGRYPRYAWSYPSYGWRFGPGFALGPYPFGPGYPFAYGPSPYWYGAPTWSAPHYPQRGPCDYRYQDCGASGQPSPRRSLPSQSVNPPFPNPDLGEPVDIGQDTRATKLVAYRGPTRREVQNALNALRRMPPSARKRWLASGRYTNFSLEEQQALRRVSDDRPSLDLARGPF
jgi:hypothetical protein